MYTQQSELVKEAELKLLMSENLLKVLKYRCWEDGYEEPSETIDIQSLDTFRTLIDSLNKQLSVLEEALA